MLLPQRKNRIIRLEKRILAPLLLSSVAPRYNIARRRQKFIAVKQMLQ
jgi:hypothetical protein